MNDQDRPFKARKTFGLDLLLKLTKTRAPGIVISETNGNLSTNVGMNELKEAVDNTIEEHHIQLDFNEKTNSKSSD